ncbi:MerR family transcriptional regulator [Micromonospora parathelypteridis]|uniref:DNA-binding transcriptional MerR regulator n=1 Tax=Micromonospora parathelypteridis TaxID=1839617 RepID=A0A840W124_9ACTN|nr:MerR family transcriptional regulator [Micromonospora parathelypteridis]MBB5479784.1 DNA-binding transcriptional MerR regulator [Micromonospora parathelypteridis]GGO31525.1 MerR family transcriptional regulator [Micromonospora parathelypteridis]
MSEETRYTIGDLAQRTGLSVKTIRYYADSGIVPPTDRSPAGYRRYGPDAVTRLELVRTLRDLGVDLATIRRVVERQVPLHEVAAAHAEALAVQIRALRSRQAVLTVAARRGSGAAEVNDLHRLAQLTAHERKHLVDDFLETVFAGLGDRPTYPGVIASMTPDLPDEPTSEQVEAWLELAELCQDPTFRANMRRLTRQHASDHDIAGLPRPDAVAVVRDAVSPALAAGLDPAGPEADAVVTSVTSRYASLQGRPADAALRQRLLDRLTVANDPRRDRYLDLLSVLNGWSTGDAVAPAVAWFLQALHARMPQPSH